MFYSYIFKRGILQNVQSKNKLKEFFCTTEDDIKFQTLSAYAFQLY